MNHDKYISELVSEYDCVIIPGFGGFIGNYTPARIHAAHHTFFPPFKSLLFNANLKQNDGLLAAYISREEKIGYEDALLSVGSLVRRWNLELYSGGTIDLENVGKLTRDKEGNIQFEQDEKINLLPGSYGLSLIISPAIKREVVQKRAEKRVRRDEETSPVHRLPVAGYLKWAALFALPLGTAALLGISNLEKIKSLSVAYSGILFSSPVSEPVRNIPATKAVPRTVIPVVKVQPQAKEEVKQVPSAIKPGQDKPFAIIIGAFRFLENAEALVSNLRSKGYDAAITGQTKTGLYRVRLNAFADKQEAFGQLALVRSKEFPTAWLLVK